MPDTSDRWHAQVRATSRMMDRTRARLDLMHDGDERMDMPDAERDICRATNALRAVLDAWRDAPDMIPTIIAREVGAPIEDPEPMEVSNA